MAATDDLSAELIKFNAFLASEEDQERQARAQKKALRLREEAAATLKKVTGNPKASKEEKDEAEAAWKAAIATEERVKAGGPLVEPGTEPEKPAASADDDEPDATPQDGDEATFAEVEDAAADTEATDADEAAADASEASSEPVTGSDAPPAEEAEAAAEEAAPDENAPADEVTAEAAPAPEAPEAPEAEVVADAPPIDEPALDLPDDVEVQTAAEATDASSEAPVEPAVVGDFEGDEVPPAEQTEYPEAGSDAPAAG